MTPITFGEMFARGEGFAVLCMVVGVVVMAKWSAKGCFWLLDARDRWFARRSLPPPPRRP